MNLDLNKCKACSNVYPNDAFKTRRGGGQSKKCVTCVTCRDKVSKRNALNRRKDKNIPRVGPVTRNQTKKGGRSEPDKKHSAYLYNDTCVITGIQGPAVEMAHIIPKDEVDTWKNIIPLRADLHKEFDFTHSLWAFDPGAITESPRKGFMLCRIIHSDKGGCDHCSVKDFTGTYEIRIESREYIEEKYKRFMTSAFPEDIADGTVAPPTYPYVPA
jgi:hypothetical protein